MDDHGGGQAGHRDVEEPSDLLLKVGTEFGYLAIYMAGRTDYDVQLDLRERRQLHLDQGVGGEYPCLGVAPGINAASELSAKFCT